MDTSEFIEYLQKSIPVAEQYFTPDWEHIIVFTLTDGKTVTIEIK